MTYNKFFKIYFLLLLLLFSNFVKAEQKIVYVDINFIMNNSSAGKSITQQLDTINKSNLKAFNKSEESLKSEETKLLSQKNVLDETEFKKKIIFFREKLSTYNVKKKGTINEFEKKRTNAQNTLTNYLTAILANYSEENSIAIIILKQNILMGKNELNITSNVLKLLDNKIDNIKLK